MSMSLGIGLGIGVTRGGDLGWWQSGSALDLDFANSLGYNSTALSSRTPDSILTYTNPSAKMVYGSDGVLRYAPHNLLRYSEQFETIWGDTLLTVTSTTATSAPDGSLTAYFVAPNASTSVNHRVTQVVTLTAAMYTYSVYAKAGGYNFLVLQSRAYGASYAEFNLAAGTTSISGADYTSSIIDAGDGWYRCSITFMGTASSNTFDNRIFAATGLTTFAGDTVSGVYLWGAQLNRGPSALTYIPTTTAAVYSLPIDHNPTTFEPLGVLIEEQRTNLLQWSQEFDNGVWVENNATVETANQIVAPDGTMTADKLVSADATIQMNASIAQSSDAAIHTFSVYAKKAETPFLQLFASVASIGYVNFDLNAGEVGTSSLWTGSIVDVGGGWYRCVAVTNVLNVAANVRWRLALVPSSSSGRSASFVGNGVDGLYIWGAQLEAGAFPTSYIPTVASQVTRLADQVSILTSAFAWSNEAGYIIADFTPVYADTASIVFYSWNLVGSSINYIRATLDTTGARTGQPLFYYRNSSSYTVSGEINDLSPTNTPPQKWGFSYSAGSIIRAARNGATTGIDVAVAVTSTPTNLVIGSSGATLQINGHYKRFTYGDSLKSAADLQVLTA